MSVVDSLALLTEEWNAKSALVSWRNEVFSPSYTLACTHILWLTGLEATPVGVLLQRLL